MLEWISTRYVLGDWRHLTSFSLVTMTRSDISPALLFTPPCQMSGFVNKCGRLNYEYYCTPGNVPPHAVARSVYCRNPPCKQFPLHCTLHTESTLIGQNIFVGPAVCSQHTGSSCWKLPYIMPNHLFVFSGKVTTYRA